MTVTSPNVSNALRTRFQTILRFYPFPHFYYLFLVVLLIVVLFSSIINELTCKFIDC